MVKESEKRIIEKMSAIVKASEERILAAIGSGGVQIAAAPAEDYGGVEEEAPPAKKEAPPARPQAPPARPAPAAEVITSTLADSDKNNWAAVKGVRSTSGVQVEQSCVEGYNLVRLDRNGVRWVMFEFDSKMEWIYPTKQGAATEDFKADWAGFVDILPAKKACYVLYNFTYMDQGGSGYAEAGHNVLKGKMVLFAWTDSKCGVRDRMVAASSQAAIKQVCRGSMDQPVHDKADMEYDYIAKELGCNR
jgi:hypothetical protein